MQLKESLKAMNQPAAPFSCTFSPNLPELLEKLNCTICISTYQAGKVIFISPKNSEELVQLPRTFEKAMGLAFKEDMVGIATKNEVIVLKNSPELASNYPNQPNTYDSLFIPRATYYTGQVDIHDLGWGTEGLWGVNTSFSCLCLIDHHHSFIPKWQPKCISHLNSGDRCHLNGMAMSGGVPVYASSLGTGDSPQSWRENITAGGAVHDVASREVILNDAPMPHSPRIFDKQLYMLLSATGEVVKVNVNNGSYDVVASLSGFVRGMDKIGDYLFVGLSKLRKNSSTFKDLPIAEKALKSGISVVHLPTGAVVAELHYETSVDEIYDVQILPGLKRPGILNTIKDVHKKSLSIPGRTFWASEDGKE